jgi:seryl-tRNA(Sec) selenium transferase
MDEASRYYVHLDELMEAVGKRLAELTGAEWGIVTAGCAAALTHATAACIAGADPERIQRLPDPRLKNEVIAPRYSRNVYDQAIRMLGVRIVEVSTKEELAAAINPRTALIMVLAGPGDRGPLGLDVIAEVAKPRGVPILVDAAAERLTIPNVHLQRGATMVAYSGGKCLRGPQCAGLLLGPKNLLQAAFLNSAPHHSFGRSMKVGKEEIMGMLAAVEAWVKRDHKAEWEQWESWLEHIAARVRRIEGVETEVLYPESLSNHAPRLRISWDGTKLGIWGQAVEKLLLDGDPRIVLAGSTGTARDPARSSVTIMPYMMSPGEEQIVAERLHAVLSKPPKLETPRSSAPPAQIAGQWNARLEFVYGSAEHSFVFEQEGAEIRGHAPHGDAGLGPARMGRGRSRLVPQLAPVRGHADRLRIRRPDHAGRHGGPGRLGRVWHGALESRAPSLRRAGRRGPSGQEHLSGFLFLPRPAHRDDV